MWLDKRKNDNLIVCFEQNGYGILLKHEISRDAGTLEMKNNEESLMPESDGWLVRAADETHEICLMLTGLFSYLVLVSNQLRFSRIAMSKQ